MKIWTFLAALSLVAASCGGSTAEPGQPDYPDQVDEQGSSGAENSSPGQVCALLTQDEIEAAAGIRVTGSSEDNTFSSEYVTCTWTFEPISEGIFEGEVPELVVSAADNLAIYEQFPAEDPEIELIGGIGDEAFTRGPVAFYVKNGSKSASIASFFLFDSEDLDFATETTVELGRLVNERL